MHVAYEIFCKLKIHREMKWRDHPDSYCNYIGLSSIQYAYFYTNYSFQFYLVAHYVE